MDHQGPGQTPVQTEDQGGRRMRFAQVFARLKTEWKAYCTYTEGSQRPRDLREAIRPAVRQLLQKLQEDFIIWCTNPVPI
ncbi:hypothetical protein ABBQ38_011983 [Trebouxia sp. C0009 RCD-2024]